MRVRERDGRTYEVTDEQTARRRWLASVGTEGGTQGQQSHCTAQPLLRRTQSTARPTGRPGPTATLAMCVKVVYIDQRLIHDWLVDSQGVGPAF